MKKIKGKYADQDEEDREMMMEFLGSRGNKNRFDEGGKRRSKGVKKKNGERGQKREEQKEEKKNTFQRADEELPPPQVHFGRGRVLKSAVSAL